MNYKLLIGFMISLIIFSAIAFAIPGIPHQFYGSVTYNGAPAPNGVSVVAKINNVEVASTTTKDGKYGYNPVFYVEDPNNDRERKGETINFFVNGIDTGVTAIFQNSASTRLDFSVTGPAIGGETPPSGGGGGGGGFGGGITPTNQTGLQQQQQQQGCIEKWSCTEWSACENGVQTRTCNDKNNCGSDLYRPFESQPCGIPIEKEKTTPTQIGPTGFMTYLTEPTVLGTILAIVLIAIGGSAYWMQTKKKAKKKK